MKIKFHYIVICLLLYSNSYADNPMFLPTKTEKVVTQPVIEKKLVSTVAKKKSIRIVQQESVSWKIIDKIGNNIIVSNGKEMQIAKDNFTIGNCFLSYPRIICDKKEIQVEQNRIKNEENSVLQKAKDKFKNEATEELDKTNRINKSLVTIIENKGKAIQTLEQKILLLEKQLEMEKLNKEIVEIPLWAQHKNWKRANLNSHKMDVTTEGSYTILKIRIKNSDNNSVNFLSRIADNVYSNVEYIFLKIRNDRLSFNK